MVNEKLKSLKQKLQVGPFGSFAVTLWLKSQGAYQQLLHEYKKNGWLPLGLRHEALNKISAALFAILVCLPEFLIFQYVGV